MKTSTTQKEEDIKNTTLHHYLIIKMEEFSSKHKSIHSAAHHIALECIQPQDGRTFGTPNESPILGRALCLTPRGSPLPGHVSHLNERFQDSLTITSDTDALVAKISAMFPTVSETHIKILLKKYYNREAVVISALQVEKHPITTPGPLAISPSMARLQKNAVGVYSALQLAKGGSVSMLGSSHLTPLTVTPQGSPQLLRPASGASGYLGMSKTSDCQTAKHQSPKMKLKYLKSIFPKAEETLILDILANKDNNVQKASEELIGMGFCKKETTFNQQKKKGKDTPQPPKKIVTIMKTLKEKNSLKEKLQKKYDTVAERVISIALESVEYNEERAEQILNAVIQEGDALKVPKPVQTKSTRQTIETKKGPTLKSTSSTETKYKSQYRELCTGPDASLRRGPNDSLLLEDYMAWNGPNPELRAGQKIKPQGPLGLAKGPAGLAKGSIYQKLTK